MSITVYNTLTRKKEEFDPVEEGKVGIYLCGPTVYKPSHIGHAVGPIIFDAIARFLKYRGYDVRWVVNITDVDDKLIAEADRQNRPMLEIAREIEDDYKQSMEKLGVVNITDWPRATEYIDAIVGLVKSLVDKGAAYVVDGDVYFDHTAKSDYGKLSGRKVEESQAGTRDLQSGDKKHPADFALWKAAKEGEPAWESPWGQGRPGWHIECSAMSMKILGDTFDIHGGGMDLIFPHHENEIAQSECASGHNYARYWMHNGLTRIRTKAGGNEKMSKSLGNIRTIRSLLDEYEPETIRAFVLSTHYRRPLDFSDEQIQATAKALEKFYRLFDDVQTAAGIDVYGNRDDIDAVSVRAGTEQDKQFVEAVRAAKKRFFDEMDDDFNTAGAMAALHEIANAMVQYNAKIQSADASDDAPALLAGAAVTIVQLGRIIGLFEKQRESGDMQLDEAEIQQLINERLEAKKEKSFARADEIRDELAAKGIQLEDTPGGTIWRKA
ncbi:MAG: cysteine--tRNA ligase [Phycisphaerae bacterium]